MRKIKKMNIVFIYRDYSGDTVLSFLGWIYKQCNSKDIKIIEKFWFDYWHLNGIIWNLSPRNENDKEILYL
jgi:hypothetical protein